MKIGNLSNAQRTASKRTKRQSIRQVFGKYRPRCAKGGAGIVGARAGRVKKGGVARGAAYPCVRLHIALRHIATKASFFPCTRGGGSTHALRAGMLKTRHGGVKGGSCTEKALKTPGGVVFFF